MGYTLNVVLSDATTGELKGLRVLALNNNVSKNIYKMMQQQKDRGYSQREYDLSLNQIYLSYPTSKLVKLAIASGKAN